MASITLHHENMRGLNAVNSRAVFCLNARQIEALMPPRIHVGNGEPLLEQRKVRSTKRPEGDRSLYQESVRLRIAISTAILNRFFMICNTPGKAPRVSKSVLFATRFLARKNGRQHYRYYKREEDRSRYVCCFPFCHSLAWLSLRLARQPELVTLKSADETGSYRDHRNDQHEKHAQSHKSPFAAAVVFFIVVQRPNLWRTRCFTNGPL